MAEIIPFSIPIPASADAFRVVTRLSVEQLKRAWDSWDDKADPGCFIIEAIHREMNQRGEGQYVAI